MRLLRLNGLVVADAFDARVDYAIPNLALSPSVPVSCGSAQTAVRGVRVGVGGCTNLGAPSEDGERHVGVRRDDELFCGQVLVLSLIHI